MAREVAPVAGNRTHVDAYCSTGTSPGRSGSIRVRTPLPGSPNAEAQPGSVRYEIHGPAFAPAVVVLGGISASHHLLPTALDGAPGWWPGVAGPGQALDPARHRLVGVEWLTRSRASAGWPISATDQAHAVATVLDGLRIGRATLVGASYGGMVALAFAEAFPLRTEQVVVFCAAHRTHPMATAFRSVQRRAVRLGAAAGLERDGLALARALAMATYRSAEEFEERFSTEPEAHGPPPRFPVESYLEARGRIFAETVRPDDFLALSESIDAHRVDPSRIDAPSVLVSFDTDTLVPPWLVDELARRLGGPVEHHRLSSLFGHDAFLKETSAVSSVLTDVLGDTEAVR